MDSNFSIASGRVSMFHPSGARVELPIPQDPTAAFNYIQDCLNAGFLPSAPDIAGLDRLDVAYVVRCQFGNGKTRLYFYKSYGEMGSDMTVYMDSATDIANFERASGLKLDDMPIYEGDAAPQRTGSQFPKYAIPTNFTVSREKEAPSQKYKTGRWVLKGYVGFANSAPQTEQPQKPANGKPPAVSGGGAKAFPNVAAKEAFVKHWDATDGLNEEQLKMILGVKLFNEYTGTLAEANAAVENRNRAAFGAKAKAS